MTVRSHGDSATLEVAKSANAVIVEAVATAEGRVIKSLGEGLLVTFPSSRMRDAVNALRAAREKANEIWRSFDSRCELHATMTIGTAITGRLGLTHNGSEDVLGLTVH